MRAELKVFYESQKDKDANFMGRVKQLDFNFEQLNGKVDILRTTQANVDEGFETIKKFVTD
jgi:hypothetical protein